MKYIMIYGGSFDERIGDMNFDSWERLRVGVQTARTTRPYCNILYCVSHEFQKEHSTAAKSVEYLIRKGIPDHIILWNAVGHNTLTETFGAIQALRKEDDVHQVIIVTHWYHIPRVWLHWRLLGWKGALKFRPCWRTGNPWGSIKWEIVSFIKLIQRVRQHKIADYKSKLEA